MLQKGKNMLIARLRNHYHRNLCNKIIFIKKGIPNFADGSSKTSVAIALKIADRLNYPLAKKAPPGQTAGILFEQVTKDFLNGCFLSTKVFHALTNMSMLPICNACFKKKQKLQQLWEEITSSLRILRLEGILLQTAKLTNPHE